MGIRHSWRCAIQTCPRELDQKYTYIELLKIIAGYSQCGHSADRPAPVITLDPENPKRLILDQVIENFKLSLGAVSRHVK